MTATQLKRILDLAERFVVVMEKRLDLEFPPPGEPVDAEFVQVGKSNADQPETKEEYEEFPGDETRSFESIIADLQSSKGN